MIYSNKLIYEQKEKITRKQKGGKYQWPGPLLLGPDVSSYFLQARILLQPLLILLWFLLGDSTIASPPTVIDPSVLLRMAVVTLKVVGCIGRRNRQEAILNCAAITKMMIPRRIQKSSLISTILKACCL